MGKRVKSRDGFSVVEVTVSLFFSALFTILVLELLGAEIYQSRRLTNRNEENASILESRNIFNYSASISKGFADQRYFGNLAIKKNSLIKLDGKKQFVLFKWADGSADFSYSKDGKLWEHDTSSVEDSIIRFRWRSASSEMIWIAP